MAKVINQKDRGLFLTIMLIFEMVSLLNSTWRSVAGQFSYPLSIVSVIGDIIDIAVLYGIWTWRKWGVYLLIFHAIYFYCHI